MKVLSVMAHPDDAEFLCAGTLALLGEEGWGIGIATMTPGDVGSMTLSREEIAAVRRGEAADAAAILRANYTCLEFEDLTIAYGEDAKRRVCELMRRERPDIVITHARTDYMADHEETARIVVEAAFASTIPNWEAGTEPPCGKMPVVLHADPVELIDAAGNRVSARKIVDITDVIGVKERTLARHESQRSWLKAQHGEDEYILSMKRWAAARAKDFKAKGVRYAEGFNQHLGHGFPKDDLLTEALGGKLVRTR